jgi:hypothetical protein
METLKELNKKYKEVLDGISLVFAIANSEYGYSSESSDEDD